MLFVIDFDGTLALSDTVDTLLTRYAPSAWQNVEQEWLDGRINAVECMKRQIGMVSASRAVLENYFRGIEIDPTFLPFYRHVTSFADIAIVSDGLDNAISIAMSNAGMPELPVFANHLIYRAGDIEISFPHLTSACAAGNGVCKCAVARELSEKLSSKSGGPVVLVGDGKSDACLASEADIVFAKSGLLDHCISKGIAHISFSSFADILEKVKTWPARRLRGEAAPC